MKNIIHSLGFATVLFVAGNNQVGVSPGNTLPSTCIQGSITLLTSDNLLYVCPTTNNWVAVGGGGTTIPSGLVTVITSGTCPSGWTEESSLNGKMLRGTLAVNANVGASGGSDTITPTGTNSTSSFTPVGTINTPTIAWPASVPTNANESSHTHNVIATGTIAWPVNPPTHVGTAATFAGNALVTHAHELPFQIPSTTTIRQIAVATFGTGTARAATSVSPAFTANVTSAAVALSEAKSAGTPAGTVTISNQGTVAWPAAVPTLTGSSTASSAGSSHTHTISWPASVPTNSSLTFTGSSGTVSAPTFTGTQFDNRAAYTNVIFCRKN